MRDPNRIDPLIEAIRSLWKAYPDLRLGQLMENIYLSAKEETGSTASMFYMEDSIMEKGIERTLDSLTRPR